MSVFENQVLKRLSKGDASVMEILYSTYYVDLCTYAFDFVKERQAAEDIVSEAFFRLLEKGHKLKIETSLRAYLYRLIHNKCVNYLDHQKVVRKHAENQQYLLKEEMKCFLPGKESPFYKLVSQEASDQISKSISELPERCRQIFEMSRFEGLKYGEIAEKLGIGLPTVKTQMSIALSRLREALREYLP